MAIDPALHSTCDDVAVLLGPLFSATALLFCRSTRTIPRWTCTKRLGLYSVPARPQPKSDDTDRLDAFFGGTGMAGRLVSTLAVDG